ncbi:hypothetical protein C2855_14140 [Aeromonas bestiarum]|nr:hypothetical protein C2855_14140 [Aeromonas bestiarum]
MSRFNICAALGFFKGRMGIFLGETRCGCDVLGETRKKRGGPGQGRMVQIKKSRRCRKDKAGSSNKEWLYKQKLYSKD